MQSREEIRRLLANLDSELNAAALYQAMAESDKSPKLSELYSRMAAVEREHAAAWAKRLEEAGHSVSGFRPSLRTRLLLWLARRFGGKAVLPALVSLETRGASEYAGQPEAAGMIPVERSHARLLLQMERSVSGGLEGGVLAQIEGRHRSAGGNALRAAVLGASDGLLSNFNLVMGVAGAGMSQRAILLTGFAGLLAGAISMALGEWISVQSSRELYEKQLRTEREEIEAAPEEEAEELALIYQARGLEKEAAHALASQIMSNRNSAFDVLAREELGIEPKDLGGSSMEAAVTSFLLFAVGALIPVVPFLLLTGPSAVVLSAALSGIGLFAVGAAITLFTGRSVLYSGFRQLLFGFAAAAVVFLTGRVIGVGIAG